MARWSLARRRACCGSARERPGGGVAAGPAHPTVRGRSRGRGRAAGAALRLARAGPRGGGLRGGVRGLRRCAARRGGVQLHGGDRTPAPRPGGWARRRGGDAEPLVHRRGERHPAAGRPADIRGYPAGGLQRRSRAIRRRHRPAHRGHPGGAPARHALRSFGPRRDRQGQRRSPDRGRRLRRRQRDTLAGSLGEHRQAAWRRGLLLVPSAQDHDHRRRGHDHHDRPRLRRSPAPAPGPRHGPRHSRPAPRRRPDRAL